MKMKPRAQRRHHYQRLKKKRKNYWGKIEDEKRLGQAVDTPCDCSCMMCGNQRKIIGETRQEKRAPKITDW